MSRRRLSPSLLVAALCPAFFQCLEAPRATAAVVTTTVSVPQAQAQPESRTTVSILLPSGHRAVSARLVAPPPGVTAGTPQTQNFDGHALAIVALDGAVPVETTLQLEVVTELDPVPAVRRLRNDPERDARTGARLRALVANPEALDGPGAALPPTSKALTTTVEAASEAQVFAPTAEPSLDGSGVKHLIITSQAMSGAFERLAAWRTSRGLPSQVRTIEWIESRTRQGVDRAETLRNFLIEAYQLWGIEWVLLGGDTDIIPARLGRTLVYVGTPDETSPSDLYYACLDGTWNDDHDGYWGEGGVPGVTPSEADIFPEVHVGRAPVSDPSQADVFVGKIIAYETPYFTDYQQKLTLLHEVLIPANWDSGQSIVLDGAPVGEDIISESAPPEVTHSRLYDTYWSYPGATKLTKAAALAQFNQGTGIVNHLGHGYRYTMSVGDISIVNGDADQLSNGDRTCVLFLANCAAVAFDVDCLAEHHLRNPVGGAAGVIGAARSVSAVYVIIYNRALMRQLYEFGEVRLGEVLDNARLERSALAVDDNQDRQLHFALNTLGDPAMHVFTGPVRTTQVTHVDTLVAGASSLDVVVTADSLPLVGATVCAFKADDVYVVATTDSAGNASLPVTPHTAGDLLLSIIGWNVVSVSDTIAVVPATPALLSIKQVYIDDQSVPPSWGNGNGWIDAGEVVQVDVVLENTGGVQATTITGLATSANPSLEVMAGTLAVASLQPAESQSSTTPLLLHALPTVPDGTVYEIPVQLSADGGGNWEDTIRLLVCAPHLEVVRVQALPQGQNTAIQVDVKNYGSGRATGLQAFLTAGAPVIVVTDSAMADSIPPLEEATLAPVFEVDLTGGVGDGVSFSMVDEWGRELQHTADLVPPDVATGLSADAAFSPGVLRLLWDAPADADILGYHVFRRPVGGNYTRITPDAVHHRDYRDGAVVANSQYEYYVVAVDSSCQWSEPSGTVSVTTPPPQLAGWPLQVGTPTSSSVVVGDIEGNAVPEILVGADGIYAWHADAQEVIDGDGLPSTFGLFSSLPGSMNASLALGELYPSPGLEIVAASWLSNTLYVFDGDGSVLPGWPQQPSNGGNPGYWASPAIGDVDNDGSNEIAIVSKDGYLYVWHADGTPLIPATDGQVRFVGAWTQNTPALADLNGDDKLEIVVAASTGTLHVIDWTGTDLPGWPVATNKVIKASPAIGDVDGDSIPEIVFTNQFNLLYVLKADGTNLAGFPVDAPSRAPDFSGSPALGDLDGDGKLEIALPVIPSTLTASEFRVYDYQGHVLWSKPVYNQVQSSPILADMDGNGIIDVVVGGDAGVLYGWDANGVDLPGFPIPIGDFIRGTPAYADVDLDGFGDLVFAGWNRQVYIWSLSGRYQLDHAPWRAFHGDMQNRGFLSRDWPTPVSEAPVPTRLMAQWAPNPFNPRITVQLAVPAPSKPTAIRAATETLTLVRVDLFDVRGRLVRRLVDGVLPPGWHTAVWDGTDGSGHAVSSGVYLYRVQAGNTWTGGKVTLVR